MQKHLSILGSTGTIGVNTLNVVRQLNAQSEGSITVEALAANTNIDLLEAQAKEFRPSLIAVFDEKKAIELQRRLPNQEIFAGIEGLKAAASFPKTTLVVLAMVGTLGLIPAFTAVESGKNIALANKEALVSGGSLMMSLAKAKGVSIIPVDSEHNAIFQCLEHENPQSVNRIILTASGGPFRHYTPERLAEVTLEEALCHPTWNMGPKITVDCSTLMNKGLEVIEAHWLFGVPLERIEVVIHPQSIIHSMVEFVDGSMLAQMSQPSMVIPIQHAITHPERCRGKHPPFDFKKCETLQFFSPDTQRFPCLKLAFDAIQCGGSMPCYMNAANEVLVNRFISRSLSWSQIHEGLAELMSSHQAVAVDSLEGILAVDALARKDAAEIKI